MQTTLLGLALAFILALLTALVGPYFMDWGQFRTQFEREVARATGMQVRVDGEIKARLLPSPSLSLRDVAIGQRLDANNVSVEQLDVELSLGDLMRGEWRATELSLTGLVLEVGLDPAGRMKWNAAPGNFNLGAVTVDRFRVNGAVAVMDAASNISFRFDNIAFAGEVRGIAGALRGEGAATFRGTRYPFRLATGRSGEPNAQRLRLTVDPLGTGFGLDIDGVASLQNAVPKFEGGVTVLRSMVAKAGAAGPAQLPWRVAAKVKADPAGARLDQIETVYGGEDFGVKLAGDGTVRFGAAPRLEADLAAKQIDVDRLLTQGGFAATTPGAVFAALREGLPLLPRLPLAAEVGVKIDVINFGPRPMQALELALATDGRDWSVNGLQLRGPGGSQLALTGTIAQQPGFIGEVKLDSNDPVALSLWLQGASDSAYRVPQPVRLSGRMTLSRELAALEGLKFAFNDQTLSGRLALATSAGARTKLDADLAAQSFDGAAIAPLLDALSSGRRPDELQLRFDIGELRLKDQLLKPFAVSARYDAKTVTVERLHIGDAEGVAIDGRGALDRETSKGQFNVGASAASLDRMVHLLAPVAPTLSRRLSMLPPAAGNVWAGLTLGLDKAQGDRTKLQAALDVRTPQFNALLSAALSPQLDQLQSFDIEALGKDEANFTARLEAREGDHLAMLLGLDKIVTTGSKPLQLDGTAHGKWNESLAVKGKLAGPAVEADIAGTLQPSKDVVSGAFDINIAKADIAPLVSAGDPVIVAGSSRWRLSGRASSFGDIDLTLGGSRLRGKLQLTQGEGAAELPTVAGDVGIDVLDVPAVTAAALGASSFTSSDPFRRGRSSEWRGELAISALRATLGQLELRPLATVLRSDGHSFTFEKLAAGLGGGQVKGEAALRKSADGVNVTGQIDLTGVDGPALRYRDLTMPTGRVSARLTWNGAARSPAALITALTGTGTVKLEQAGFAGLDPEAFAVAIAASDKGAVRDDMTLGAVVAPALAGGVLPVAAAEVAFTLRDGQLRVGNTAVAGEGADLTVSGGYDILAEQVDIRAVLSPTRTDMPSIGRPDITVLILGAPGKPQRTVDVASLSAWLGLRAIDRETKRLEAIEKTNPLLNPSTPPAPKAAAPGAQAVTGSTSSAPQLPPPIEVKPAPSIQRLPPRNAPLVIAPPAR